MKAPITYTAREYTNMLLCYGAANCVTARARAIYRAKYPNYYLPPLSMFVKTFQPILENEAIRPNSRVKVRDVIDSKVVGGKFGSKIHAAKTRGVSVCEHSKRNCSICETEIQMPAGQNFPGHYLYDNIKNSPLMCPGRARIL